MLHKDPGHATGDAVARNQIPDERIYMGGYHEGGQSTLVLYDLRDAEAWQRAGEELQAWGKVRTSVHSLSPDHVIIEYRPGGAADLRELA